MSNNNNTKLGQYFTTNNELKEKVFSFILNKPEIILEPSIGQGDLVLHITDKIKNIKFDMYEIDKDIKILDAMVKKEDKIGKVIYGDFMIHWPGITLDKRIQLANEYLDKVIYE